MTMIIDNAKPSNISAGALEAGRRLDEIVVATERQQGTAAIQQARALSEIKASGVFLELRDAQDETFATWTGYCAERCPSRPFEYVSKAVTVISELGAKHNDDALGKAGIEKLYTALRLKNKGYIKLEQVVRYATEKTLRELIEIGATAGNDDGDFKPLSKLKVPQVMAHSFDAMTKRIKGLLLQAYPDGATELQVADFLLTTVGGLTDDWLLSVAQGAGGGNDPTVFAGYDLTKTDPSVFLLELGKRYVKAGMSFEDFRDDVEGSFDIVRQIEESHKREAIILAREAKVLERDTAATARLATLEEKRKAKGFTALKMGDSLEFTDSGIKLEVIENFIKDSGKLGVQIEGEYEPLIAATENPSLEFSSKGETLLTVAELDKLGAYKVSKFKAAKPAAKPVTKAGDKPSKPVAKQAKATPKPAKAVAKKPAAPAKFSKKAQAAKRK